ncbi:Methylase involved in ubiquinone/menaquinone biosynthesis [Modestobacter italicus]|uniref:Methylase involved in ubiquinone/menaquinone biosynthesis n=1 Tax=Modestobacter italicus (strain DSM 44449 / CECT 9708 / BC 501) TaxID=2732864 RepID=I4EV17_MODI5|nr:class I SAM-dependent methyltransferase [Modestobacter marinus]CCH87230.1 Methylase involved in ubiquinone/menaquinone biosynthesis [Modestobacter marinus]
MDDDAVDPASEYVLGSTDPEMARLAAISRVYGPLTGAWLDAAGVRPGMRVADLGCGPGDVALAAARRVGPTGSVVGVDDAVRPLERARRRAADEQLATVTFEQGDVLNWAPAEPLDAIVGRFILMHLPDPVAAVVRAAELVRPGGIVAFADVALTTRGALPELPLLTAYLGWLLETLRRAGRPVDMALRLAAVFAAAGLPDPVLTSAAPAERGGDAVGWSIVAGDLTSLLPVIERTGVATAAEIGPDTFEQRLRAQAAAQDAVLLNPLVVGASARVRR